MHAKLEAGENERAAKTEAGGGGQSVPQVRNIQVLRGVAAVSVLLYHIQLW